MDISFYKRTTEYTVLTWKNMIPGLSDTIITLLVGGILLKVASVVLISMLALNIALGSFATLVMMHSKSGAHLESIMAVMLRGALAVASIMLFLSVVVMLIFPADIGIQSFQYLIFALPRPFITIWTIYHREFLFQNERHRVVQKLATQSLIIYIAVSWMTLYVTHYSNIPMSAPFFLIGVYSSSLYTAIRVRSINIKNNRVTVTNIADARKYIFQKNIQVTGIASATKNSVTNVLEVGFMAAVGWLVTAKFSDISAYYFPLFNMIEWASAFAIGLSRVYTERHISKERSPDLIWLATVLIIYSAIFVAVYQSGSNIISSTFVDGGIMLYYFAVIYVLFDGLQLVLRSYMLAQESGGYLLHITVFTYILSFSIVAANWLLVESAALVFVGLLFPVMLTSGILIFFVVGKNEQPDNI